MILVLRPPRLSRLFAGCSVVLTIAAIGIAFAGYYFEMPALILACPACLLVAIFVGMVARRSAAVWSAVGCLLVLAYVVMRPTERATDQDSRVPIIYNIVEIGYGLHNWHNVYKRLPGQAVFDATGSPLLSWRVTILPFLDHHADFKITEAWDGPHNRTLLKNVPHAYVPLYATDVTETPFQAFVGPGTAFEPGRPLCLDAADFPDGLSNTILIAEMPTTVPWSKPADEPYAPDLPLPKFGREYSVPFLRVQRQKGFMITLADASVRFVHAEVSETVLRSAIVRNDAQVPDWGEPLRRQRDLFTWHH